MSGPRIALDAFGADQRPTVELQAAIAAAEQGLDIDLVGDAQQLGPGLIAAIAAAAGDRRLDAAALARLEQAVAERVQIVHAPDQIGMDESPGKAVRGKPQSSLVVAVDRVAAGASAGVVSAGNSGALLAAGLFRLGRIPGVDRPAILTSFPRALGDVTQAIGNDDRTRGPEATTIGKADRTWLIDAGANIECRPLHLVQFAVMGAVHARLEAGLERPRVAVLANGSEPGKGTALTQQTHQLLAQAGSEAMDYVGYVEPGALFGDACDVAVTDGWTGNMALKLAEGAMAAWPTMLREALRGTVLPPAIAAALSTVSGRVDPEAHGGAPLVGVDGTLIICHGASGSRALLNGLTMARRASDLASTSALRQAIVAHGELFEAARDLR